MSERARAVALLCTYEEIRYMGHMGLDIPNSTDKNCGKNFESQNDFRRDGVPNIKR